MAAFDKKDPAECDDDFERFLFLLKHMYTMEKMPFTDISGLFKRVEEVSCVENLSPHDRRQYEHALKVYMDLNNSYRYAVKKGLKAPLKEGFREGQAEGLQMGRAEGLQEGRAVGMVDTVCKFIAAGMDVLQISRILEMPPNEVESMLAGPRK